MTSVTRLTGGVSPADGADPRTFPVIWNATATIIEANESAGSAVSGLVQDKAGLLTAGSDTVDLDFSTETPLVSRQVSGTAVSVTGSSYEAGVTRTLRLVGGTASATVSVPGDWVFVGGAAGTALGSAVTAIITATAFGTAATDVVAAYAEEA